MAQSNMSNIVYTWSILGVLTEKEYHQYTDFIYACQWQITGTTEEKSASISDRIGFGLPNPEYQFTPRSEMTEEKMVDWVKSELGAEKIAELEKQIESMLNA
jgi:hypothetical protein